MIKFITGFVTFLITILFIFKKGSDVEKNKQQLKQANETIEMVKDRQESNTIVDNLSDDMLNNLLQIKPKATRNNSKQ